MSEFIDENGVERPYTKGMKWLPWMFSMKKHVRAIVIQMLFFVGFVSVAIYTKDTFDPPFWFWFIIVFMCTFAVLCWLRIYLIWRTCKKLEDRNHANSKR